MSYIGNPPTNTAFVTDQFSGNGSTTAFTMSVAPATTGSILVAVTGVLQDPSTYSVSGTTLTFSAAPPTGTGNISVRYLGIPASGVTTTAYRTVTDFTATAGQTTFTVPSYTVGYIDVYRNGSKLGTADFTATNGTTVVLASAASAGDLIETVSFYVSSVLNAIPNTAGAVSQSNLASGVAGNGPAFSAYAANGTALSAGVFTKITYDAEEFDTNSTFASSRFTPNVAGYYQINASVYFNSYVVAERICAVFKNGSAFKWTNDISNVGTVVVGTSCLLYLNGSTDYVEIYGYSGGALTTGASGVLAYFQGAMVRSA